MKYIVGIVCALIGIFAFTSSSFGDSPADQNSTDSDFIMQNTLEEKELKRTQYNKDQYNDNYDSLKSTNSARIVDGFRSWTTTDPDTVGHFSNGNIDEKKNLNYFNHETTLETQYEIKLNNRFDIDTGDNIRVIIKNPIQQD